MSSANKIALLRNSDLVSYVLFMNQTGTFTLDCKTSTHPALAVTWELIGPDKAVISKDAPSCAIFPNVLARYRDPAGYSSYPWTLRLLTATANKVAVDLKEIECTAYLTPAGTQSQSAPPVLNAELLLTSKQSHTYDIDIDRVGDLVVQVEPKIVNPVLKTNLQTTIQLFDPAHKLLASGTNRISHPFSLRDLHAGHAPGARWHLTVTDASTASAQHETCTVLAQVYNTISIPSSVLQPRLDAIFGNPAQGGAIKFRINFDEKHKNIVYVKISEDLYFTLDNFGFLDTLETMRSTQFDGTTAKPAPVVPIDPGVAANNPWYPITTFDGGSEIHNLETGGVTVETGNGGDNKPTITLTVPLLHNPNGQITKLTKPWSNNWNPLNDPGGSAEIKEGSIRLALTIALDGKGSVVFTPVASLPVFSFNLIDLPDWLSPVKSTFTKSIQSSAASALGSDNFLSSIFKVLMGGMFTIQSATWANNAFEFNYIPATEEAPHTISPYFSARGTTAPGTAPTWTSPNLEKIDHIVVLMMENRSFDHVFGHLSLTGGRTDIDGLTTDIINSFDANVRPSQLTESRLPFDPDHSFQPVKVQIGYDPAGKGPMRGFVTSFVEKYPFMKTPGPERKVGDGVATGDDPYWIAARRSYEQNAVMRYHTDQTLPYFAFLAKEYTICDRFYASHPGPTLPNRFFYLMGHLSTDASGEPQPDNAESSLELIRGRTIQDALTERGVGWKMYESPPDVSMLRMFARYAFDDVNIRPIDEFFTAARAGALPSVTFLEPNFHMGVNTNDDHPPCDMANGQRLLQSVHDALTANQAAWNKTMLIITYDEHGGLYDHHLPELADRYTKTGEPVVDIHYGVRVPSLVVSPWVPAGGSSHQVFDHTSILKTIVNRFCPADPAIMSDRMAFANDLFPLLTLNTPRAVAPLAASHAPLNGAMGTAAIHEGEEATAHSAGGTAVAVAPLVAHAVAVSAERLPAHSMIADAKALNEPVPRNHKLFAGEVDWHQYMTRLGMMLK